MAERDDAMRRAADAAQGGRAGSIEMELAREAASRQVAQVREDTARKRAELRAALEAQVAVIEEVRAERAERELDRTRVELPSAGG
jgi:hypothetical protein